MTGFAAGQTVYLFEHPHNLSNVGHVERDYLPARYVLRSVEHWLFAPDALPLELLEPSARERAPYRNRFTCLGDRTLLVPARVTPRPRIHGLQTAKVVGPHGGATADANEEVHVDPHGRVRAQFHWDLDGREDGHSSCWIRVQQSWAGPGYGTLFIPRVGMEVVVSFLEGNPDRPLITGCVYNGENRVHEHLPHDKTVSTIRTSSSPGMHGFNELRFEDRAHAEEIFLHAQRNLREVVRNVHTTDVGADQHNHVHGSQTEAVDHDQTLRVDRDRGKFVARLEKNIINGDRHTWVKELDQLEVNGTRTTVVNGTHNCAVRAGNGGAGDERLEVEGSQRRKVHGEQHTEIHGPQQYNVRGAQGRTTRVTRDDFLRVGGNLTMMVDHVGKLSTLDRCVVEQRNARMTMENQEIALTSPAKITLTCGQSSITIEPNKVTIESPEVLVKHHGSPAQLRLNADAELQANQVHLSRAPAGHAELILDHDDNAVLHGQQVKLNI